MTEESKFLLYLKGEREAHIQSCKKNRQNPYKIIAGLYKDPTHFIYELIQNADDESAKEIHFIIKKNEIEIQHNGRDFDCNDIDAITALGDSKKENNETAMGKFGIGFKSVFTITDSPQIHSGKYHFKIENYIVPEEIKSVKTDRTIFYLPLKNEVKASHIIKQIEFFAKESLLFLNNINTIKFSIKYYKKSYTKIIDDFTYIKDNNEKTSYLVFEKEKVKIAYKFDTKNKKIIPAENNKIFLFFPTEEDARVGFLIHAPYHPIPNRGAINWNKDKNRRLTKTIGKLFSESLLTIKKRELLTVDFFESILLSENSNYEHPNKEPHPAVEIQKILIEELKNNKLLPTHNGAHVVAGAAKLADTKELCELFSSDQLKELYQSETEWLSGEIIQGQTPQLHRFLKNSLSIKEIRWEVMFPMLTKNFFEAQTDDWICKLYSALDKLKYLKNKIKELPLIRLKDGEHVIADPSKVFLPRKNNENTKYSTVSNAVCNKDTKEFLETLGLRPYKKVNDVIDNILPDYDKAESQIDDNQYEKNIKEILEAHKTDSQEEKEKLEEKLKESYFVKAIDLSNNSKKMARPDEIYLPTSNLKELFSGISDILFIDDNYSCLKGDAAKLIETCGAKNTLRIITEETDNIPNRVRETEGWTGKKWRFQHRSISGLKEILEQEDSLNEKALLLWQELGKLGETDFEAKYKYSHYGENVKNYKADFLILLKEKKWIPHKNKELKKPEEILFSDFSWDIERNNDANRKLAEHLGIPRGTMTHEEVNEIRKKDKEEKKKLKEENERLVEKNERLEEQLKEKNSNAPPLEPRPEEWIPDCTPKEAEGLMFSGDSDMPPSNRRSDPSNAGNGKREESEKESQGNPKRSIKIGRWGEEYVYRQLCKKYGAQNVCWNNEQSESAKSYDISVTDGNKEIFVEVKSTIESSPLHNFEITRGEYDEAKKCASNGNDYHFYCVIKAGTEEPLCSIISTLERIEPKKYQLRTTEKGFKKINED